MPGLRRACASALPWAARAEKEPAYCALTTLTVVLNALSIDPGRGWKGPWRWYHEGMLDTCTPLAVVKQSGITLDRFVCLAEANGAASTLTRADASSEDELRELITRVSRATPEPEPVFLVASYSRKVLGQTGDGHMSPIAGVHTGRDLALILDVARFKCVPPCRCDALAALPPRVGAGHTATARFHVDVRFSP